MNLSKKASIILVSSILSLSFLQTNLTSAQEPTSTPTIATQQKEVLVKLLQQLLGVYQQMLIEIQQQERTDEIIDHISDQEDNKYTGEATGNEVITIDRSTLNTTSHNPTFTGSSEGLYSVELSIYNSKNENVDGFGVTAVKNGRWTMGPTRRVLENGTYKLIIKGRLASNDYNEKVYATETLIIK